MGRKQFSKEQLKEKVKELPLHLSIASIALLLTLAERGAAALSDILEGPGRTSLGRSYKKMMRMKTFWDYYDELKGLQEDSARTMLWRLQQKGLVDKKEKHYQLTSQGLNIIQVFQKKADYNKKEWDGKWRIVMFDIPEKQRNERYWLRYHLFALDYKPLQKSVFLGKYPIEEDMYQKLIERELHQYVRLITVGEIDDEQIFEEF